MRDSLAQCNHINHGCIIIGRHRGSRSNEASGRHLAPYLSTVQIRE